jgi:hypothetical protein
LAGSHPEKKLSAEKNHGRRAERKEINRKKEVWNAERGADWKNV